MYSSQHFSLDLRDTSRSSGLKRARALVFVFLFHLLLSVPGHAQKYLGSISGEVTDPSGAKVPGAKVTATDLSNSFVSETTTTSAGVYSFGSVNPGSYAVSVSRAGFSVSESKVLVTAGQEVHSDFHLSVAGTSQSVQINTQGINPLWDTGSANLGDTLNAQEVSDTPNFGRNPYELALLSAGASSTTFTTTKVSVYVNQSGAPSASFNGVTGPGASFGARMTLNGLPDDPTERTLGASDYTGFAPTPESVEEVKTQTSIFDAEYGHGPGSVVNTVVKGGSNKPHGALYYVFQNTYLNANTYERVPNQYNTNPSVATPRANDQLSQSGFVFDGPVVIPHLYDGHDKTYFMVAYEWFLTHNPQPYSAVVPTAAERTGDFSDLCAAFNAAGVCTSGVQIYDPLTKDTQNNRTPFAYNKIPSGRINGAGAAIMSYFPLPNASQGAAVNFIAGDTSYRQHTPDLVIRIDHNLTPKDKINGVYFWTVLTQQRPQDSFPKEVSNLGSKVLRKSVGGVVDETHIFSNSTILDTRFGIINHPFSQIYPLASNFDLSQISMNGANLPYQSFPGIGMTDSYAELATGAASQLSNTTVGDLSGTLTKIIRTHSLRVGFEGNVMRFNAEIPFSGVGPFSFNREFTQKNSINVAVGSDANSGNPMASLLLGYPSSGSYAINIAWALQQLYMAPFVQDDWRITPKLTANLGLRWDYEAPSTERYNRLNTDFCATCVNPLQSSVSGLTLKGGLNFASASNRYPYPRDLKTVEPRLGVAYLIHPNVVFRGGFGTIYNNTFEAPLGQGFSATTSYIATIDGSVPVTSLSNPFPSINMPSGSSLGLSTQLGQNVSFNDPNRSQPRSMQYSTSVQIQIPGNAVLQVAYVGTRNTSQPVSHNINAVPAQYYDQGAAGNTFLTTTVANPMAGQIPNSSLNSAKIAQSLLLLPYPEFGTITDQNASIGHSNYNGLQITASKPLSHGLSLHGNFTWAKTMLHTSFRNPYEMTHLASDQDPYATLVGNIVGTYQLPLLASQHRAERLVLGGWKMNVVYRQQNGNLIGFPSGVTVLSDPTKIKNRSYEHSFNTCYLDTAGAEHDCSNDTAPAFQLRLPYTSQVNSLYMHLRTIVHPRWDFSMFKTFEIREKINFEIRGEFFNIMNSANFGAPNVTPSSAAFGQVTLTQANDPRLGQLTARINF
jgi:Carboxypeptidase regulatory-like domain/TonB dependent receptor